jgi:hypothetical protein
MPLPAIAKAALADHLPLLREGALAKRFGWIVMMDDDTGLCHVRLQCPYRHLETVLNHAYLLRLSFDYYPLEQPGAIFVNPATREIGTPDAFERWWPNLDGNPWINLQINASEPAKSYLCFQWTQEFKQSHSAPAASDPKRWDPNKHSVVGVVNMVQKALNSSHYKGFRKS